MGHSHSPLSPCRAPRGPSSAPPAVGTASPTLSLAWSERSFSASSSTALFTNSGRSAGRQQYMCIRMNSRQRTSTATATEVAVLSSDGCRLPAGKGIIASAATIVVAGHCNSSCSPCNSSCSPNSSCWLHWLVRPTKKSVHRPQRACLLRTNLNSVFRHMYSGV